MIIGKLVEILVAYFIGLGIGLAFHDRLAAWWARLIKKQRRVVSFRGLTRPRRTATMAEPTNGGE